jgi:hypothetical protein
MLKRRLCEASIAWRLQCTGPLLIADGRYTQPKSPENKSRER